jgi:Rrf2 family protein
MVYLASAKGCCSIREISEATGISAGYLEQLMIPLKRSSLVVSERGVQGGYRLARTGITCHDVIAASEGQFNPAPCKGCDRTKCCKTCVAWNLFRDEVNFFADRITVEQLADTLAEAEIGGGI